MLSFRAVFRSVWVGAAFALCAGFASEASADTFTFSNACLEDREACLRALAAETEPPAPELAAPEEDPILLSNRHVGMSREELSVLGIVEGEEAPVETVEIAEDQPFHEESAEPAPAPAPAPEVGFTSCVEASVRAGNGLSESVRVCRSVFMN